MRIPRRLKIGGRVVKVIQTNKIKHYGDSDYEKGIIRLKSGMSRPVLEATLIHEIFHFLNTTMNHTVLDGLAEQWYAFLIENKLLK